MRYIFYLIIILKPSRSKLIHLCKKQVPVNIKKREKTPTKNSIKSSKIKYIYLTK